MRARQAQEDHLDAKRFSKSPRPRSGLLNRRWLQRGESAAGLGHTFFTNFTAQAHNTSATVSSLDDVNGALETAVKEKLNQYHHDYNEHNFFFLPAVMTTSGRISGDFLRLIYILSHCQAEKYFTRMGIIDPSPQAFKQRRGAYFYYNRAAIGLACAQALAMRIDIAPHKRPRNTLTSSPTSHT